MNATVLDRRTSVGTGRSHAIHVHLVRAVAVHIDLAGRASAGPRNVDDLAARSRAKAALNREATHLRTSGLEVRTHARSGAPAAVVLEAARAFDAGLIVMASHARGGLVRWLVGSVADEVLRQSSVPVLVVRAGDIAWSPNGGRPPPIWRMHWTLNCYAASERQASHHTRRAGRELRVQSQPARKRTSSGHHGGRDTRARRPDPAGAGQCRNLTARAVPASGT
jgi:nucleotide-binding universal stress UspA family protein